MTDAATLGLEAALTRIFADLAPIEETETVALSAALARILREDVVSPTDVPGADNSAVDGYALYAEDLAPAGETRLPVVGRAAAGHPFREALPRGAALRIFTGALMPTGPDTVVMQEDCRREEDVVVVPAGIKRGSNRRRAGEDVKAGATVLAAGIRLRPQEIGLAAAVGRTHLTVAAPLRAALFSTSEDADPLRGSGRQGLAALLWLLGLQVQDHGTLPGDAARVEAVLATAAAECDAILVSGGAGVPLGSSVQLWHLAVKPGRTIAIGRIAALRGSVPLFGLPANPVAALVAFLCLVRPALLRLMGARDLALTRYRLAAAFDHRKKPGWREYLRARRTGTGEVEALTFAAQGSGIPSSLLATEGLIELPEALTRVERGSMVDFLPLGEVV